VRLESTRAECRKYFQVCPIKPVVEEQTSVVDSKSSGNLKSYQTAATLFAISGLVFVIVSVVSSKIGVFLPVGIALVIIDIGFWQRSKKFTNG
jgi:Flp pilus assembly protein TadB